MYTTADSVRAPEKFRVDDGVSLKMSESQAKQNKSKRCPELALRSRRWPLCSILHVLASKVAVVAVAVAGRAEGP